MTDTIDHHGSCHCGNLDFTFEASKPLGDLALRICGCRYCQRQDALYVSDAAGRVRIAVRDPDRLLRYRFGHATADFVSCGDCGIYFGAVMEEASRAAMVLNVKSLDLWADAEARAALGANVPTMDYDSEDEGQRLERRWARWTPLVFEAAAREAGDP